MEIPIIESSYKTQTQNKKVIASQRQKNLAEKVTPFLNKMKTMKNMSKYFAVTTQVKK